MRIHIFRSLMGQLRNLWNLATLTTLRKIISAFTAAAVLAIVGVAVYIPVIRSGRCAQGVERMGASGECIGVTDGSFIFEPQLKDVENAIFRENESIKGKPYVTVALLLPLTISGVNTQNQVVLAPSEILHEVQGAYIAQHRANHDSNGVVPEIRLVLANPGATNDQWGPVTHEMKDMTGPPDNLRAVIGIGVSTAATRDEVSQLTSRDNIPVVSGAITADDIANSTGGEPRFPGLARVSPTNGQVAKALAHFAQVHSGKAILVEDTRANDDYVTTLENAFSGLLGAASPVEPFPFNSQNEYDPPNEFAQMVPNICQSPAKWIYFAGRQIPLRQFINALGKRGCASREFTILTGSAGSDMTYDQELDRTAFNTTAGKKGITLDYAAIAYPNAWQQGSQQGSGYGDFTSSLNGLGPIGPVNLQDGEALINYDAMLTSFTAIRNASPHGAIPSLSAVDGELPLLNGVHEVDGATGRICLDDAGNPYNKAVPVVRYGPGDGPAFVQLAWPTGSPPSENCEIPPGG